MENDQPTAQYVTVEIYGQAYHLSSTDLERVKRLAARVDDQMRAVSAHGRTVDSLRVAVLAALNLADELARAEERAERLDGLEGLERVPSIPERGLEERDGRSGWAFEERAHRLSGLLDTLLDEPS